MRNTGKQDNMRINSFSSPNFRDINIIYLHLISNNSTRPLIINEIRLLQMNGDKNHRWTKLRMHTTDSCYTGIIIERKIKICTVRRSMLQRTFSHLFSWFIGKAIILFRIPHYSQTGWWSTVKNCIVTQYVYLFFLFRFHLFPVLPSLFLFSFLFSFWFLIVSSWRYICPYAILLFSFPFSINVLSGDVDARRQFKNSIHTNI